MNKNQFKLKSFCGLFGDALQLVLCHFPVGFIFDSFDLKSIFKSAHNSPEIEDCSSAERAAFLWRFQRRLGQQNFANGICHALQVFTTVGRLQFTNLVINVILSEAKNL